MPDSGYVVKITIGCVTTKDFHDTDREARAAVCDAACRGALFENIHVYELREMDIIIENVDLDSRS